MECLQCKKELPPNKFETANVVNGKQYKRKVCTVCRKDYKNKLRQRNSRFIQRVKRRMKCKKCGMNNPICLTFHHPNKDKFDNVSNLRTRSIRRIKEEIRKCVVLCANCHLIEHNGM